MLISSGALRVLAWLDVDSRKFDESKEKSDKARMYTAMNSVQSDNSLILVSESALADYCDNEDENEAWEDL